MVENKDTHWASAGHFTGYILIAEGNKLSVWKWNLFFKFNRWCDFVRSLSWVNWHHNNAIILYGTIKGNIAWQVRNWLNFLLTHAKNIYYV